LAYEVNQNSDAIRLQAAQSNLDTFYALDLLIAEGGIEDQSLARLLVSPAEDRSLSDQFRYERFADTVLSSWQNNFYLNEQGVLADDLWEARSRSNADLLRSQPDCQDYWESSRSYYTASFNAFLDDLLLQTGPTD
jgi:hypothetical protein